MIFLQSTYYYDLHFPGEAKALKDSIQLFNMTLLVKRQSWDLIPGRLTPVNKLDHTIIYLYH